MKISKLFHWLYAILMLLPFVSVLSFTLYYAFNKNAEIPMVTENVSKEVDFNQYLPYDIFPLHENNQRTITLYGNVNVSRVDYYTRLTGDTGTTNCYYITDSVFVFNNNDKILVRHNYNDNINHGLSTWCCGIRVDGNYLYYEDTIFDYDSTNQYLAYWRIQEGYVFDDLRFCLQVFNLTQMFGSGNEPTIEQFNIWFPNDYYPYILSDHLVIDNYDTREVVDSPINHIWLPSFGGMGWMIKNVFTFLINTMFGISVANGIGYTILYLLTYWLCISLIWLIYDVIMYVPLMIHRWLDKGVLE